MSNNIENIHNVNPDISWSNFGSILTVRKNPKIYNFEDLFSLQFASADQLSTSSNGRPLKTSIPTKSQKNNFSKHIFVIQRSHSQLVSNERRDKNTSISGLFCGKSKRTNTLLLTDKPIVFTLSAEVKARRPNGCTMVSISIGWGSWFEFKRYSITS